MANEQQLQASLKSISDFHWNTYSRPILLSNIPAILEKEGASYKEVLGTRTLKSFIKDFGPRAGFKLIEHPTLRAKVAVAPIDADYEFPAEAQPENRSANNSSSNQDTVLAFLRVLSKLPSEELEKVIIPVSTLVKLLK